MVSTSSLVNATGSPFFLTALLQQEWVIILVSAAPSRLIIKMTAIKKYRPYQAGYHAHGDSINSAANGSTER
jgi:hypothetical protein